MKQVMDLIGICTAVAWWDGSCLDLRLHQLIDRIADGSPPIAARAVPSRGEMRL